MKRLLLALPMLAATPALAHHPLGGEAPQTVFHGVLSGLAHPVIGIDHLAFIVLVGLAAAAAARSLTGPLVFIVATILGTFIQLGGIELPLAELVIAGSVVVLGAFLVLGRQVSGGAALAGFAFAGLFHGWAYGEAVVGSTPMPVVAYLAGFAVIQFVIAAGVARLASRVMANPQGMLQARLAAAVCVGIGFAFLVETVEHLILG